MKKLKILTVFGTRPEIIKLAPFIKAVEDDSEYISVTCATTQHRELQNNILNLFKITPDYDLDLMIEGQDLFHITNKVLSGIKSIIEKEAPDFIIVQGDTTTALIAAMAGFYKKIPIVHIEAGLRTGNRYSPFPEEINRSLISRFTTYHMAPTQKAVENLAKENITENVFNVGNTIVDAVEWVLKNFTIENGFLLKHINSQSKKILITLHRRENFGAALHNICTAIKILCKDYPSCQFIWPVHPNPEIKKYVYKNLKNIINLALIEPLPYTDLLFLINSSTLILSDSGGIQEEACILGKKIIILRDNTERPEIIEEGFGVLAGDNKEKISQYFHQLIKKTEQGSKNALNFKAYGSPGISKKILSKLRQKDKANTLSFTKVCNLEYIPNLIKAKLCKEKK